jgi:hypothetical protein
MYEVVLTLTVSGNPDRARHFQKVVEAYAELERVHVGLLDASFGFTDHADHADINVEITVETPTEDDAFHLANTSVRSAIQSAGGFTPDWDERPPDGAVYRLTSETIGLVDA